MCATPSFPAPIIRERASTPTPIRRSPPGCWLSGAGDLPDPTRRDLSGLHEPIGEAIGLALDRGIEHLDRMRIALVREHRALRVQHEAGRLHFLADGCRVDPMQR